MWKAPSRMFDWTLGMPQMIRLRQQIGILQWFLFKSYPLYAHTPSGFTCGLFSIGDLISDVSLDSEQASESISQRVLTILVLL